MLGEEGSGLKLALLFSLLIHALLLSLAFGGQAVGLPGFALPWRERRVEVPDLRLVLVPQRGPLTTAGPAVAVPSDLAIPAPQAPKPAPRAAPPSPPMQVAEVLPLRSIPLVQALPAVPSVATPTAELKAPLRTKIASDLVPAPKPEPPVMARQPTDEKAPLIASPVVPMPMPVPLPMSVPTPVMAAVPNPTSPDQLEVARVAAARLEAERLQAALRTAAAKEAALQESARQESARAEAARSEAERELAARQETAKADALKQEAERQEAARQLAARQEAAQRESTRLEAARLAAARLETERLAAVQMAAQQAAQQAAVRREAAVQDVARQDALRLEAERQAAARLEAAQQRAAQAEAEKRDNDRREAARRAMGRQLDEEAAQRQAAAAASADKRPPGTLPSSFSSARRGRLFGRTDANAELVLYAEAWARKIQLNMTFDGRLREAAQRPHNKPVVTVALRNDGSVESLVFVVTSGVAEIDEGIRHIVQSQAPYPAFTAELAREFDVIEIRRTWHFDTAVRLY